MRVGGGGMSVGREGKDGGWGYEYREGGWEVGV